MPIFVFQPQPREDLRAFAAEITGRRLPDCIGLRRLISGAAPGGPRPHGIPRRAIRSAIQAEGFPLWRLEAANFATAPSETAGGA